MDDGFASIRSLPLWRGAMSGSLGNEEGQLMSGRSRFASGQGGKLRIALAALLAICMAVVVAACGSDSGSSSGGGSETKITGAKVIDPASMDSPPKGTIHYCQGKDTNGAAHENVALFNKKYASQGYKVELTEFPASADQQRAQ